MNQKGAFNFQGMLISMLMVGLLFGIIGSAVYVLQNNYDATGYDANDISAFNKNKNLSSDIDSIRQNVDGVTADSSWFDWFSGIWSKILIPFKTAYRSFETLVYLTGEASDRLQLLPVVKEFLITIITILVIIGLVMIKYFLGRNKNE